MRILHLAAGAGGMYCGACARDVGLARELIRRGHDVEIVPLYTPLRFDGVEPLPTAPVQMGGVNAYLEQVLPFWRSMPGLVRGALNRESVLNLATRFAVSTRAADLGPMIVSVLQGAEGRQRRSLMEVMAYVQRGPKPDLVSVTNSLLTGIAPILKRNLNVPIVCGLQGEDDFVAAAPEPHRTRAIDLVRRNARSVDLFLSPGIAYAAAMAAFLDTPPDRITHVRVGIDPAPYRLSARSRPYPFTIGYLSVITEAKGLDILVDALLMLLDEGREVELAVAGKIMDPRYWERLVRRLEDAGRSRQVRYLGEVDFRGKVQLFRTSSVVCVASRIAESRGVVALEAQSAGVPVVLPDTGVFPEMIELTRGGMLYRAQDPADLARAIARLMDQPDETVRMGRDGPIGIGRHYTAAHMADGFLEAIRPLLSEPALDVPIP